MNPKTFAVTIEPPVPPTDVLLATPPEPPWIGPGGGLLLTGDVAPSLVKLVFLSDTAPSDGGGAAIESTSTAPGTITISDSIFGASAPTGNVASGRGGGLYVATAGAVDLLKNIIFFN